VQPDPVALIADAARHFRGVRLDAAARSQLARIASATDTPPPAEGGASTSPARGAHAESRSPLPPAALRGDVGKRGTAMLARWRGGGGGSRRRQHRVASVWYGALVAQAAERVDAYVLHTNGPIVTELCAWAQRFEAREGRPPTVWLRDLCAEPSLSAAQQLALLPCALARCEQLLLLASPQMPHDFEFVVTAHVWSVLGGQLAEVAVELVGGAPAAAQTVAAFDAFHVMHATVAPLPSAREHALVAERLCACVQFATVRAVNSAVRELLPAVSDAAATATRRAAEAERSLVAQVAGADGSTAAEAGVPALLRASSRG
jgi:enamine deaminase RidA (YjgF/YER057c/UK114 family)